MLPTGAKNRVYSFGADKTIRLWDFQAGRCVGATPIDRFLLSAALVKVQLFAQLQDKLWCGTEKDVVEYANGKLGRVLLGMQLRFLTPQSTTAPSTQLCMCQTERRCGPAATLAASMSGAWKENRCSSWMVTLTVSSNFALLESRSGTLFPRINAIS